MRYTYIISLLLVTLFVCGCGNNNPFGTVYVEGTVTVDGAPMQGINVTFNPAVAAGMSGGGMTDAEGKFKITSGGAPQDSGAKPGKYDVTFYKASMEGSEMSMEELAKKYGNRPPPKTYIIPRKYSSVKTSGLEAITVETDKNKNKFTFELQSK